MNHCHIRMARCTTLIIFCVAHRFIFIYKFVQTSYKTTEINNLAKFDRNLPCFSKFQGKYLEHKVYLYSS